MIDTNGIAVLLSAAIQQAMQQTAQPHPLADPSTRWDWVGQLVVALVVGYTAWLGRKTHIAVNSTASALAADKKVADAVSLKQSEEIATLRQKVVGQEKAAIIASGGVPVEMAAVPGALVLPSPVAAPLSDAQLAQIVAAVKAAK